jgi:sugar transferase (PEP-CTERM/EpsH1 system associated)
LKILFLANRVPYPPFRGDKLKIYNLAKRLCGQHELHLLTFAQTEDDFAYEEELRKVFTSIQLISLPKWRSMLNCIGGVSDDIPFQVHYFKSAAMTKALEALLSQQHFDVVHVQHLRMAQYLENRPDIPRILDLPDAFSLYWKRKQATTQNPVLRFFERLEQKRVYRYERILERYQLNLVCSKEDKAYLQQEHGLMPIELLPNGVDTSVFYPRAHDYGHYHTLLFTGNMDYGPNIDAVCYFVQDILPLIRNQFPDIRFIIAGQRPVARVSALANDFISVTGFIPDLSVQYDEASVVVAPLRFGAGTQNKVLEAMAMGVPVVCSHIGFEGLDIRSGEGAVMQTTPESFAQSVVDLLSSETLRREVGEQGIKVIQARFSWDKIALQLQDYFMKLSGSKI